MVTAKLIAGHAQRWLRFFDHEPAFAWLIRLIATEKLLRLRPSSVQALVCHGLWAKDRGHQGRISLEQGHHADENIIPGHRLARNKYIARGRIRPRVPQRHPAGQHTARVHHNEAVFELEDAPACGTDRACLPGKIDAQFAIGGHHNELWATQLRVADAEFADRGR